jgi:hypothetical protein
LPFEQEADPDTTQLWKLHVFGGAVVGPEGSAESFSSVPFQTMREHAEQVIQTRM